MLIALHDYATLSKAYLFTSVASASRLERLGTLGRKDLSQFSAHLFRLGPFLCSDRSHARPVRPDCPERKDYFDRAHGHGDTVKQSSCGCSAHQISVRWARHSSISSTGSGSVDSAFRFCSVPGIDSPTPGSLSRKMVCFRSGPVSFLEPACGIAKLAATYPQHRRLLRSGE